VLSAPDGEKEDASEEGGYNANTGDFLPLSPLLPLTSPRRALPLALTPEDIARMMVAGQWLLCAHHGYNKNENEDDGRMELGPARDLLWRKHTDEPW